MKKDAVTNKIRLFKAIKPNPDWLESQRRNLLLHIKSDEETQKSWSLSGFFAFKPQLALKPVMATVLALTLIFGAGFLTISAAKDSVPGDFLFPVKITLESVQLKFSSQKAKTALQVEFVSHRAEELNQIVEEPIDLIEKKNKAMEAASELKDQLAASQDYFKEVEQNEPERAAEIAKQVVEKNAQSEQVLCNIRQKLVEEFNQQESEEIAEVIEIIDQSLAVLAKTEDQQAEQEKAEVTSETGQPSEVDEPVVTEPTTPVTPASESSESSASFEEIE
ncbi:MAG: DUF5667 domain-containing protein [Petrotogales bacterium]